MKLESNELAIVFPRRSAHLNQLYHNTASFNSRRYEMNKKYSLHVILCNQLYFACIQVVWFKLPKDHKVILKKNLPTSQQSLFSAQEKKKSCLSIYILLIARSLFSCLSVISLSVCLLSYLLAGFLHKLCQY